MAGVLPAGADRAAHRAAFVANLAWAAPLAASAGIELLIEPINPRDVPGYLLNRQDEAHAIVAEVGAGNLKVQMDLYHCQIVEGDVAMKLRQYLPTGRVGHLQIAGVPERQEPDTGELYHPYLFALIDELGYNDHIGCEYRPAAGTSAGLGWMARYKTSTGDMA
jgi:hydroxypyruvate isomerase